jgi:transposase
LSTKIHAGCLSDHTGVALVLTEGQRHESPVLEAVLAQVPQEHRLTHAIMDKAYDSDQIRVLLTEHHLVPVIPPKSNRRHPIDYDHSLYRLREKIERFFNKLKQFRRIATRYEKLSQTFLAFIQLVATWISLQ